VEIKEVSSAPVEGLPARIGAESGILGVEPTLNRDAWTSQTCQILASARVREVARRERIGLIALNRTRACNS
jgi:hypothetical protein